MNLLLFIAIPLLTALAVLLCRNQEQVKWTALVGSLAQLVLSVVLLLLYNQERSTGNSMQMLFEESYVLFSNPPINFHFGVDGLSVAMILLTSFVLVAGILVSWNIEKMTKEFY